MKVRVTEKKPNILPKTYGEQFLKKVKKYEANLHVLGMNVAQYMKDVINSSSKWGEGDLANAIQVELVPTKNKMEVNIANIGNLPDYWYVINYGTTFGSNEPYVPPINYGEFMGTGRPVRGGTGDVWVHGDGGPSLLIPGKPLTPIHYIEKTKVFIREKMDRLVKQAVIDLSV